MTSYLDRLPNDVKRLILGHLSDQDKTALAQANEGMRQLIIAEAVRVFNAQWRAGVAQQEALRAQQQARRTASRQLGFDVDDDTRPRKT